MPCAATQTGLWCPLGLNVLQARNPDSNAPIQRLATMRLPWRQNTLRFLPIDAQAPGLLGHICRSISSRTHKHAGKRRAAIMNKTSADATRLTAPPALHWARDSRAHHPRRHGPTSTFYQFFFSVVWSPFHGEAARFAYAGHSRPEECGLKLPHPADATSWLCVSRIHTVERP